MCNAWNHSLDCSCGWGGDGHLGRRTFGNNLIFIPKPKFKSYIDLVRSCTIPNAKCPKCGNAVFFYRSPSNGRVFFDELGPPWPKHPCTSSYYVPRLINNLSGLSSSDINLNFYDDKEWKPFLLEGIFQVDKLNKIYEIIGFLNDRKRTFYTNIGGVTSDFPFFIKETSDEIRLLTFKMNSQNNIFEFVVKNYRSDLVAITNASTRRDINIKNLKKPIHPNGFKNNNSNSLSNSKSKITPQKSQNKPKLGGKLQVELMKLRGELLKNSDESN
jgi:hypothetical protein